MAHEARTHRHLDWRTPLEWLGSSNYWVLETANTILAALACPADPPHVSWIRLFGHLPHLSAAQAWSPLWELARTTAGVQIAAIVVKPWFEDLLSANGFTFKQNIVMLELQGKNFRPIPTLPALQIRPMRESDLPTVAELDLEAFGPFWHNSLDALQRAYQLASYASVAEDETGLIGYQLSTGNPFATHLARLAVGRNAQGRGIGSALVSELIQKLNPNSMPRLSVNTQADNAASLAVYKKIGFIRTGESYPVLTYSNGDEQ
ncbi:MAG: GNAT family N-acetyltransferase [Anaerolineales bacterium]|nr:GNAT family N-acetyltransferase [Anaerolineales bacterium]